MGGGGGLIGGASQVLFGDGGAGAAGQAAIAQQTMAEQQYAQTKQLTDRATVAGLASFDRDIKNQERNLARQEQLVSQIDPTIIEASQQALKLLRGEDSSTLNPLKKQRDVQRQKLVNSLREQLGPGAETSTAGIQALTRFDSESGQLFAGAQQQAISNLGGVANQFTSSRPDMFREIAGLSQFGQGGSNLLMNQASILSGQGKSLIDTAGGQYAGDVIQGKQNASFGSSLLNGAITAGAAYALGDPTKSTRIGSWFGGGGTPVGSSGPPLTFK